MLTTRRPERERGVDEPLGTARYRFPYRSGTWGGRRQIAIAHDPLGSGISITVSTLEVTTTMPARVTRVVAISRAIGSEGERIGALVSERLGFRYVDEEIITTAAEKQGVDPSMIADAERRKSVIQRVLEGLGQSGAAGATPGGPTWVPTTRPSCIIL